MARLIAPAEGGLGVLRERTNVCSPDGQTYVVHGSLLGAVQPPEVFQSRAEAQTRAKALGLTYDWVVVRPGDLGLLPDPSA